MEVLDAITVAMGVGCDSNHYSLIDFIASVIATRLVQVT